MKRRIHLICASFILMLMAAAATSGQQVQEAWSVGAVTPAEFNQRIEEAAREYSEYAPIPRVTFYDIAYPTTAADYNKLDGHAILLLSAFSQQPDELPLKRVYVVYEGEEIELKLIKSWSQNVPAGGPIAKTFGTNRMEAIFLLPIYMRVKHAPLLADFAARRQAFRVADFKSDVPEQVSNLPIKPPTGTGFSSTALIEFIRREYPGLLKDEAR